MTARHFVAIGLIVTFIVGLAIVGLISAYDPVESTKYIPANYTITAQYYDTFNIVSISQINQTSNTGTIRVDGGGIFNQYFSNVNLNATFPTNENGIIVDRRDLEGFTMLTVEKKPQSCIEQITFKNGTIIQKYIEFEDLPRMPVCDLWTKNSYTLLDTQQLETVK